MPTDKRSFKMSFRYFRDRDTINFERTQKEMICPYNAHKLLSWKAPDGRSMLLNRKNRFYMTKQGPFKPPYYYLEDQIDQLAGQTAFIICPGPSMDGVDLSIFKDKFTLCVNSAGFKFNAAYWIASESNWLLSLRELNKKFPVGRRWVMTSRVAVRARGLGMTPTFGEVYVSRFEDVWLQPHRTPAISTTTSLFTAWWLGAPKVYVVGLDLSRPGRKAYAENIPVTPEGCVNPFDEQILALRQFAIPEFQVFNGSPHSQGKLPFTPITYKEIEQIARDAPPCKIPPPVPIPPVEQSTLPADPPPPPRPQK